jgi:hypothetical protein
LPIRHGLSRQAHCNPKGASKSRTKSPEPRRFRGLALCRADVHPDAPGLIMLAVEKSFARVKTDSVKQRECHRCPKP